MIFSRAFRDFMATGKMPSEAIAEDAGVIAQDKGTSEGAMKGWETKRRGSSYLFGGHKGSVLDDVYDLTDGGDVDDALAKKYSSETGKSPYDEEGTEREEFSDYKHSKYMEHVNKTPGHDPYEIANSLRRSLGLAIAQDAAPGSAVDLKAHDARFHGGHYDGKGSCKYREALAKGDSADDLAKAELAEEKAKEEGQRSEVKGQTADGSSSVKNDEDAASTPTTNNQQPTTKDYRDLADIRDRLERVARLLNGRAGNLAALQSSSRWNALNNYPKSPDINRLGQLGASSDKALAKAANDLETVAQAIVSSKANGWTTPAGMVPPASAMPTASGQQQAGAPQGGHAAHNAHGQSAHGGGNAWTPFSAPSSWASQLQAANANHPAATDPNWFKDQADKLTPQQAVADMEARGDIVKGGYRDTLDANDPDEHELWAGWRPSKKLSDDTARCCSVCFDDLRKRFPNMPWKSNLELRCGTKPMTGGQSTHTQDWRRHTVLFNCDYGNIWPSTGLGKSNYGHSDARFPFDVLRHEMGHALISGQLPNGKRMITKWHDAMTAAYGNPATDLEKFAGRYVSSYAVTRKGHGFSMAECLSECFSLATSPDYQPGYLPPKVEDFIFKEMLGM